MLAEQPTGLLVHPQGSEKERQVQVCPLHCLEAFLHTFKEVSKSGSHAHTYPTKAARPFFVQVEKSFAIRSEFSIIK